MKTKACLFCSMGLAHIDYKNTKLLYPFLDRFGRIKKRYYTGTCLKHQKQLSNAVKKARIVALIPFTK